MNGTSVRASVCDVCSVDGGVSEERRAAQAQAPQPWIYPHQHTVFLFFLYTQGSSSQLNKNVQMISTNWKDPPGVFFNPVTSNTSENTL